MGEPVNDRALVMSVVSRLVTAEDAARRLQVSTSSISEFRRSGALPSFHIGGRVHLYLIEDLACLAAQRAAARSCESSETTLCPRDVCPECGR